jgi:molybdate transport repressor ModE-like protein
MLRPAIGWTVHRDRDARPRELDVRLPALLREIARTGTLTAAARAAAIPYRTAWAMIEAASRDIGAPLVDLARGKGGSLTPLGTRLLAAHDAAVAATAALGPLEVAVREAPTRTRTPLPLRVVASHDLALAQLREPWRTSQGVEIEFHGSGESLDAFHAGDADLAGFHAEIDATRATDALLARLDPVRDAIVSFITRRQGLIVARGNPHKLRSLADVAKRGLAFVNRQPGSGTRLLLDRLLAREGLAPAQLPGYGQEEFTHAAVAATVAAGRADAALGIEAAAAQFGLAFVPLLTERYAFACRRRALATPRVVAFRALLASEATAAVVRSLAGYALDRPGEVA